MVKWVCVTNKLENFSCDKTYKADKILNNMLIIRDDRGHLGSVNSYNDYFITLKEWRKRRLNEIIDEFKK